MNPTLHEIESQLKKRIAYPYLWGQKQNDCFDKKTDFIYNIFFFDDLLGEIEKRFRPGNDYELYFNYSINRWYNFWSAHAVENIFCSAPNVKPALDSKNRLVDFTIQGESFDHKTSVFPKNFPYKVDEAVKKTDELIKWLYRNQSQQSRKHMKNRLFVVLYSDDGEHWKLKSEIMWLKDRIEKYMTGFNPNFLLKFRLEQARETLADVIWAIK